MLSKKIEKLLLQVQKPSRYIGGEPGSIIKDKSKVDVRFAFCFPDTYDIGMSHLGMKILYSLTNERENYWCERVFAPAEDFEKLMRENDIPLYALEKSKKIWSVLYRINAERGRPAAVSYSKNHAIKFRVHNNAESGCNRSV